ncbi:hypothetical protein A0U40_09875 [[Bacillus] sp. KCTC 13219]|nr:hypothetical protein A0U40_09875 [[Bacillus] sp. KCTC 13219]
MGVLNKKLIRDAAGSPIPQIFDVEQGIFIAATNGTGDASNVNFSKIKMIRDALGSPIPQYFDVTQNKFVAKTSEGGGGGSGSTAWSDITGKPSSYPPSAHTHEIAEVNGLQGALTAKANGEDLTSLEQTVTTHLDNNVKHINYAVASGTNNYIVSITGIESFVEGWTIT